MATSWCPRKDNWAFLALSLFGDESTARDLTTQILAWPQEGKSARAVSGLNILTLMNNDMALIQLHHISQRAKSRPLRDNAAEFLQVVAENRGLSQEELADRLVPTLGLDDPQALSFDFGPRQFTVRFDENLNPVIFDQQNVRQKSVPRLRADDDQLKAPEALARLKGLKRCYSGEQNLLRVLKLPYVPPDAGRWQIFILCLLIIPLPVWLPSD